MLFQLPTEYEGVSQWLNGKFCAVGARFSYSLQDQKIRRHFMFCKRRQCFNCEKFWRFKWLNRLQEKVANDRAMSKPKLSLALTLTTAEAASKEKVYAAFRYFFQFVRRAFPDIEYFCTVEFNQKHTQPHFHFLIASRETFIHFAFLRWAWEKAQEYAKFDKIAWVIRIEKIKKSVVGYFFKYITKLTGGGKDEVPTSKDWNGRHVRYSRRTDKRPGFFPVAVGVLDIHRSASRTIETAEHSYNTYNLFPDLAKAVSGLLDIRADFNKTLEVVKRDWFPQDDIGRGTIVLNDLFVGEPYIAPYQFPRQGRSKPISGLFKHTFVHKSRKRLLTTLLTNSTAICYTLDSSFMLGA